MFRAENFHSRQPANCFSLRHTTMERMNGKTHTHRGRLCPHKRWEKKGRGKKCSSPERIGVCWVSRHLVCAAVRTTEFPYHKMNGNIGNPIKNEEKQKNVPTGVKRNTRRARGVENLENCDKQKGEFANMNAHAIRHGPYSL